MAATPSHQDRLEVIEAVTKMGWHTDKRNWDALAAVFADKVRLDYSAIGGPAATVPRGEIVDSWRGLLGSMQSTQHLITNHLVTVDGGNAVCTAHFQAVHVRTLPYGESRYTLGGDYRFELAATDGAWHITAVTISPSWASGDSAVLGGAGSTDK